MKIKKKIFAGLLLLLLSVNTVYADDAVITQNGGSGTAVTEVTAQIQASSILAAVPLVYEFTINPNELDSTAFRAPEMNIENNSKFPLKVSIASVKAQASNKLKVVKEDMFTESQWRDLGQADSLTHISLGFETPKVSNGNIQSSGFFMESENEQSEHLLGNINAAGVLSVKMQGKHGRSFADIGTYKYNCIVKLGLLD